MKNPTAAMLVIGDEILSGRTRDANMHYLAGRLTRHGIDLQEVRIVADCHDDIIAAVNELRARNDHLFTCGGIGPTHDDITADAVAAAFGVSIDIREDALQLIAERCQEYGQELNDDRRRMARIPDDAELILNPVSSAPGFSIGNIHVMAGVPKIFSSMLDGLLTRIPGGVPLASATIEIAAPEGEIAAKLGELARRLPDLQVGSYPFRKHKRYGVNVVLRGYDVREVKRAENHLRQVFATKLASDGQG
ncbi:MAG: competence/damage-inducible protein A [Rhodobacteraceae bacterium]|nr:competence/damage-inducible protein A [Paracoccaceae bacterium]MCY4197543.1 competence/damage-inducible protein A [Paracoccaceae bacterium]MCY4326663.1 competence/damage-inducible protein A [Paracoccaceae bacterium]